MLCQSQYLEKTTADRHFDFLRYCGSDDDEEHSITAPCNWVLQRQWSSASAGSPAILWVCGCAGVGSGDLTAEISKFQCLSLSTGTV